MSRFDPQLVGELASSLEDEAARAPLWFGLAGLIAGAAAASVMTWGYPVLLWARWIAMGLGAVAGLLAGLGIGRQQALRLRLQGQAALGQVQIERNSRREKASPADVVAVAAASSRRDPPQMTKTLLSRPTSRVSEG